MRIPFQGRRDWRLSRRFSLSLSDGVRSCGYDLPARMMGISECSVGLLMVQKVKSFSMNKGG